jgi:hypothetical protein
MVVTENQWMFSPEEKLKRKQQKNKKHFIPEPIYPFFKFFASLQLAVPTILTLMIVLAAGTILESLEGAQAAKILIYDTWWFSLILFFLGFNVFMVTIDRIPWQKKHTGFLITHLGIIIVLVGSFITQAQMIDGQMQVEENDGESFVTLPGAPLVYVLDLANKQDWIYPFKPKALPWTGNEAVKAETGSTIDFKLLNYYPKARGKQSIQESKQGPMALKVNLVNQFVNQSIWLVEKDAERNKIPLGPATISFSDEPLKPLDEAKQNAAGFLLLNIAEKGHEFSMDLTQAFPQKFPVPETDYFVEIGKLFRDAAVIDNQLIDQAEEKNESFHDPKSWKNPALELTLTGKDFEEHHTVFAKFPEFPTVHGLKPSAIGAKIFYRLPHLNQEKPARELRFLKKDGNLFYQVLNKTGLVTGSVVEGKPIETGWMDLTFNVEKIFKHSKVVSFYDPQPNTSEAEDLTSVVQVQLSEGEESAQAWLEQGVRSKVQLGAKEYDLIYGNRRIPLGFEIFLKDFKIENNPGTDKPASFSSDVVLRDPMRGIVRDVHISMNEPLEHRGFKVYQAAYRLVPGEAEVSVFSVGRDPGTPTKYVGCFLIVLGAVIMFSMRKFSKKRGAGQS